VEVVRALAGYGEQPGVRSGDSVGNAEGPDERSDVAAVATAVVAPAGAVALDPASGPGAVDEPEVERFGRDPWAIDRRRGERRGGRDPDGPAGCRRDGWGRHDGAEHHRGEKQPGDGPDAEAARRPLGAV